MHPELTKKWCNCEGGDKGYAGKSGDHLLPPSSAEGWGKVLFSVCLSVHTRGYPGQVPDVGGGGGAVQYGIPLIQPTG